MARPPFGVPRPFLGRAVPVELDTVAVRVPEVEGLADPVVGGPLERNPRIEKAPQRVSQRGPVG